MFVMLIYQMLRIMQCSHDAWQRFVKNDDGVAIILNILLYHSVAFSDDNVGSPSLFFYVLHKRFESVVEAAVVVFEVKIADAVIRGIAIFHECLSHCFEILFILSMMFIVGEEQKHVLWCLFFFLARREAHSDDREKQKGDMWDASIHYYIMCEC